MRIGVDATFHLYGGSLTHLRALLQVWRESAAHEFVVFGTEQNRAVLDRLAGANVRIVPVAPPRGRLARLAWFHSAFPDVLRQAGLDVVLFAGGYRPLRATPPSLVIFRNAAPFCEGLTPAVVGWRAYSAFALLGRLMRHSAAHATRVLFPSRYLKQIFVERFGVPDDSAVVYHGHDRPAVDPAALEAFRAAHELARPFVLYVSHLYRYKNVAELIRGYAQAREAMPGRPLDLVIAGAAPEPSYRAELDALVRAMKLEADVRFLGPLGAADVARAIGACEFFAFPSRCENCPNTLIEALAQGKAIAASTLSAMPEICGDAARYFDPNDPASIASALTALAQDAGLRADLAERALRRAEMFPSWTDVAHATLRHLEQTAAAAGGAH